MERVDYESLIVQDLLTFQQNGSLDISPWYQRRSVWSVPQKAYLINTIFERKPVPSLYIRHQIDIENERSVKEVVDGQQRIRTIIAYRANEFSARHPDSHRKLLFDDLSRLQKTSFLSTAMSVGYLIGADDGDVIEIFGRINSISKTLNPQEKRNALYSGEFKQFCLRYATTLLPFWRATGIFTASDISRMLEVQFISDLIINLNEGVTDFDAKKIDRYYKDFDNDFPQSLAILDRLESVFDRLAAIDPRVFADTIFRQYQLTLSLVLALDEHHPNIGPFRIEMLMRDIDRRVEAVVEGLDIGEGQQGISEGFTGGNLHRIRTRLIRHQILSAALA